MDKRVSSWVRNHSKRKECLCSNVIQGDIYDSVRLRLEEKIAHSTKGEVLNTDIYPSYFLHLNNYFNFHVRLSFRPSVLRRPPSSVRPKTNLNSCGSLTKYH